MAKIVLEVADQEVDKVLTILNALKDGMILSIQTQKKHKYNAPKPIQKEPLKPVNLGSKYVDPQTFKERLRQQRSAKYGK